MKLSRLICHVVRHVMSVLTMPSGYVVAARCEAFGFPFASPPWMRASSAASSASPSAGGFKKRFCVTSQYHTVSHSITQNPILTNLPCRSLHPKESAWGRGGTKLLLLYVADSVVFSCWIVVKPPAKGGLKPGLLGGEEVGDVSRNSTVLAPAYSLLKQEQLQLTQASFGFRKSNIKDRSEASQLNQLLQMSPACKHWFAICSSLWVAQMVFQKMPKAKLTVI